MKKIYLLIVFCCLGFSGFSATWFSVTAGGVVTTLTNWNSLAGGGGTTPANFAAAGDTWIIQSAMTVAAATWNVAGSVVLNSGSLGKTGATATTITIGDSLTLNGATTISTGGGAASSIINLGGDLTVTGTSKITTGAAAISYTLNFTNTAATQHITWTSTGASTRTSLNVNTGVTVQLLSNVPLPTGAATGMTVNGTLDCVNYVISSGSTDPFTVNAGASFLTAHAAGVNGSITAMSSTSFSGAANYEFYLGSGQVTGTLLPVAMLSGGAVTIWNGGSGNVTLSQTTSFASGASLNLTNGNLINTAANLVMQPGSNVNREMGTLSVTPTTYSGVNLTYRDSILATSRTAGPEWPAAFTGNVNIYNQAGSTITLDGSKVNIGPIKISYGTLDAVNFNISLTGNWTNNAVFTPGTGTVTMNGSTPQQLLGSAFNPFSNFTLNNAAGASIASVYNQEIDGTLTLANGILDVGSVGIAFGDAALPIAGPFSSSTMMIASAGGGYIKYVGGLGAFMFPIGDVAHNYTPVTYDLISGSGFGGSTLYEVNMFNIKAPTNTNVTNYINRYWSLLNGVTSAVYSVTATYVPSDVVGTETNISAGNDALSAPSVWTKYGPANVATHTIASGNFAAGYYSYYFSGISTTPPTVTASASTSICPGNSTPLSVVSSSGDPVLTFSWAPASSLSATTGTSVIASPTVTTTYTVTVTDGNGFTGFATTTVTVATASIVGDSDVCIGLITNLIGSPAGGTWTSTFPSIASVGPTTGAVTGVAAGTTTISYAGGGCIVTHVMTVNASPGAISGPNSVCTGNNITLLEGTTGGIWTSTDVTVNVGSATGIVTGSSAGTATISYVAAGCNPATYVVTVNAYPSAISGATAVCEGAVTTLFDATPGGSWTSSSPTNGSVDATGNVTGILTGPITIFYDVAGCAVSQVMTVNPAPAAITGISSVCVGSMVNLSDLTASGTWSSSATPIATVNAATGDVSGITAGTTTISYVLTTTGCFALYTETVNDIPAAITGQFNLCTGQTYFLSDATAGGSWASNFPIIASVVSGTGAVTGNTVGTTDITYTTSANCFITQNVTVSATPVAISGASTVCAGDSVSLSDLTAGGVWSTSAFFIATVGTGGEVTGVLGGGTAIVSYTVGSGCSATMVVTVSTAPTAISGPSTVCVNDTILLIDPVSGGTWSSSASGSASVLSPTAGYVKGEAAGSVTITYKVTGCPIVTQNVTVNPDPSPITGATTFCDGLTSSVFELTPGGNWSSQDPTIALAGTLAVGTGTVTGVSLGVTNISYTLLTGCYALWTVTVNPAAPPISGTDTICATGSAWLTDIVGGGHWTSSNPAVATIMLDTGYLTGIVTGITYVVYTLPTGCSTSLLITAKPPVSPISGPSQVCTGSEIHLTDPDPRSGGTWSTSNMYVATIDTGLLAGLYPDTVVITYTISAFEGCYANKTITVNPLPAPVITYNYATHSVTTLGIYSTYQWYNDRTGLIAGAITPNYVLPHGNDSVSVTVTDANGCSGSATWFYYDYTGVKNVNASGARIFPNPATNTLFIESAVSVRAVISAVDGKTVIDQQDAKQMDISRLASGVYVVTLYDADGQAVLTGKLVKE